MWKSKTTKAKEKASKATLASQREIRGGHPTGNNNARSDFRTKYETDSSGEDTEAMLEFEWSGIIPIYSKE